MKAPELPKVYNPQDFEDRIYQNWMKHNLFAPAGNSQLPPFTVVIPPPNVTGVLHMGHGLNNSLQDILIRYWRMKGRPTLWVPGTDHAGIATQQIVERRLAKEGKHRRDLGREKFVELTWKVKEEHHTIISQQLKKIGASVDWSRERFTMDEGLSHSVRHVFVELYKRGLVYKGKYLVNWDPEAQTAIADDEVEYKEVQGALYHIKYPFKDGSGFVEVATTRPETLLGDTAVAVHPEDERYAGKVGKILLLPVADREIPLMADSFVDKEFGTGAVKITPAHDPNDFDMGRRHNLEQINILNPDGTLGPNVPERYKGLTTKAARKKIVEELKELGLFVAEEPHKHQVGHCYRSGAVIEPYLSEQWFVRMQPLADKALAALHSGEIKFYPQRWENTYTNWLTNIRDWCISRQLWWGHQIPVYTCSCGHTMVEVEAPKVCEKCGSTGLKQDEDVLDTWFSSWLWPFSTLGWPENTPDLQRFYPTTALVTAYDIIFFWVARMVMAGMEFMGKAPFRDIYMTPLIRDKQGRKMSKSLGNGIDPLEIVAEFGADAMKFTLAFLAAAGQDINLDKESFKIGSKFANKIWNASRYIFMNIPQGDLLPPDKLVLDEIDRWIYARLNATVKDYDDAMANYRYSDAAHLIYEFFWNDFCDWYIEASKLKLYSSDAQVKLMAISTLVAVLEESLRLMHPLMSFITEEIYQTLPYRSEHLITAPFPVWQDSRADALLEKRFASLQELVRGLRTLRSEFTLPPEKQIPVVVLLESGFEGADFLQKYAELIKLYTNASTIEFRVGPQKVDGAVAIACRGFEILAVVKDSIDVPKEVERLKKSIAKNQEFHDIVAKKLSNENFVSRAPADILEKEREKLAEARSNIDRMTQYLADLA